MRSIEILSREPDDESNATESTQAFVAARHFIGRLAAHQRVPRQLVEDGERLRELLEPYTVKAVSYMAPVPKPEADRKTNIDGILKRMLPANDPRHERIKEQLAQMDPEGMIEQAILSKYRDSSFQPRTHAEVQMLEHFYMNDLTFAWDEKLIGCSKPACLCCRLYFEHHPLRPAPLDSHGKIYRNWGPVDLPERAKGPQWLRFQDQLNGMIPTLRNAALEQITQLRVGGNSHPDSLTGLTVSEVMYYESEDSGVSSHKRQSYDEAEPMVQTSKGPSATETESYIVDQDLETDTSDGGGVALE